MQPRKSGQPRSPKQAALIPATSARQRLSSTTGPSGSIDWQARVRDYDSDGPGILGYYLDTVALLASLCPLVPEVRTDDGDWVPSNDPVLHTLLSGYRSNLLSQDELVSLQVRHRESMGETWIIHSEDIGWSVVTVPNVKLARSGEYVEWTDMFGVHRRTPRDRVWKSWQPDPYEPWQAWSPVRRALPDLKRLKSAVRNQTRASDSRLLTNGLIAFPDDGGGARPLATASSDNQLDLEGIDQVIDDYIELAKLAFSDDDSPSAVVPFPYIGAPAQPVELGRDIDPTALQVESAAIESFARHVNFPAKLLVAGPGDANHWNEWILQEVQHKMGLAPKLRPVCNDLTTFFFRPLVDQVRGRVGDWKIETARVRVGFDMSYLTSKPDKSAQVLQAWKDGLVTRDEAADALGIDRTLKIPEGMDEYEHWELATNKPGAPYAEVENGRLVAAPDVFADGMDPSALPVVEDPEAEGDPSLPPGEEPVDEVGAGPLPDAVTDAMAANELPPAPPPELEGSVTAMNKPASVAAASDPRTPNGQEYRQLAKTTDVLFSTDAALEAGLSGMSQIIVTAVITTVVKELIKAHPSRGPKRKELRELPIEQVWAASDPEVRDDFDLEAVVREAIAEYEDQIEQQFDEAEGAALAALIAAGILGEEDGGDLFAKAAGVALLTTLLTSFVVGYFQNGKKSQRVSPGVARAAMSAGGGAVIGADGYPQRSQGGTPVPADGNAWYGNTGFATGNNVVGRIQNVTGRKVTYQWRHAFLRIPETPYEPHRILDGARFNNVSDIPDGVFPGDHPNCTCVLWFDFVKDFA